MKILHVGGADKFMPAYIELVRENFNFSQHEFLLRSGMCNILPCPQIRVYERTVVDRIRFYIMAFVKMHYSNRVILHGLFDIKFAFILFFTPWLLKKCYWVMWGGDLYAYKRERKNKGWKRKEFFRRPVIKKMGHLVTYIGGDVRLARKWYGATGKYHECLMYPSNLYKEYDVTANKSSGINIQVGNSADPSNNHIEVLEMLLPFKDDDIAIYVPLSYGDLKHAKKVIRQGQKWFGDKFIPLTEYMPFEQYLNLLGSIDIALFNHKRQQAMGNAITLLGLGKTVYLRSDTTQWQLFQQKKIVIGDIEKLKSLETLDTEGNKEIIKNQFSEQKLIEQLKEVFYGLSH